LNSTKVHFKASAAFFIQFPAYLLDASIYTKPILRLPANCSGEMECSSLMHHMEARSALAEHHSRAKEQGIMEQFLPLCGLSLLCRITRSILVPALCGLAACSLTAIQLTGRSQKLFPPIPPF